MTSTTSTAATDGAVSIDGGTAVAVTDTRNSPTNTLALTSPNGGTVTLSFSGQQLTAGSSSLTNVSTASGSLSDVVNAINSAGAEMTATAVQVGANAYRLQVSSAMTGAAAGLTLAPGTFNGTLGSLETLQAGSDATITVGSGPNAYQVTSATNTVTGVLPGVSMDLVQASTEPVTISVATDTKTLGNTVQTMVNDINSVINQANSFTRYDPNSKSAGPLLGDSLIQGLAGGLTQALTSMVPGASLQSAAAIGFSVNTDGTIAFDAGKFQSALAANPQAVIALFTQTGSGIAQHLQTYADSVRNPSQGTLTSEINGTQADITNLNDQISAWQPILDLQRQNLTAEFNQMESTLSQLQAQSKALAATTGSSSNNG